MHKIMLLMRRDDLNDLPTYACPLDYRIRTLDPNDAGDREAWAEIEMAVGEFADPDHARATFDAWFAPDPAGWSNHGFLLEHRGIPVGTASAGQGELAGERLGRVGWVGIAPEHQGRGLAKPLLAVVLAALARDFAAAYLTTQTTSAPAVNLYLNHGFLPHLEPGEDLAGWTMIETMLNRPGLVAGLTANS